ncbi:probable aspartic proteinase GIP2 [Spinacia oleracea]|uniref:Probable aspartic proteinase GIP2 n=1 Tax=Spinacia oleracea TaxID=3562 RepID=A0A9R0K8L7_SPIOL|nr:probable aspartic proteinase GIP2 [Spinacia oleracea]
MVSSYHHHHHHHLFTFSILLIHFISTTSSSASFHPKALVLPVSKDSSTLQYTTKLIQRTPLVTVPLTLDLGTPFLWLWINCGKNIISSTYHPVSCGSPQCTLANAKICKTCPSQPTTGCNNNNNNTCATHSLYNPITNISPPLGGELATDVVQIHSTDGSNTGKTVTVPNYLFVCAPKSLLQGLPKGVSGIAGLGRTTVSLPSQFSSTFGFPHKFALCLSSFPSEDGVVLFGDGPYNLSSGSDVTTLFSYNPLIRNPVRPSEYFIGVTAIRILEKDLPLDKSLLSINNKGNGGTLLSVIHPYTVMETSIYKSFITTFDTLLKKLYQLKRVTPVAPFEMCYDSGTFGYTKIGPFVPDINLVLQNGVSWRIQAMNSLVRVQSIQAYCLGFVDGGRNPRASIVIGAYQMEDVLLQFDLAKSSLGFTTSLVPDRIRCSNFNFTSNVV